jgi:hypothetical protein
VEQQVRRGHQRTFVLTIDIVIGIENNVPVPTVHVTPDMFTVRLSRVEKVAGLLRDLRVPLTAVRDVAVVPDGLAAARGVRAPGLGIPGRRKLGTWRRRGGSTYVAVRRGEPALDVTLTGARYARVLVATPDAAALAARLTTVDADR